MAAVADSLRFYAEDRQSWRAWLEAHHRTAPGVWLVLYKKESGRPQVSHDEAVEEALCFGWIDSRVNKLDDQSVVQRFSPRNPGSTWSRVNKQRVERLIAAGLMTPAGLAAIETAKANGAWTTLDAVEDLTMPDDLSEALAAEPAALTHFTAFPPSSKKMILWWIVSAKRAETRARRIVETVRLAAENRRANHPRQ